MPASRNQFPRVFAITLTLFLASCKGATEVCVPSDVLCGDPTPVATTVTLSSEVVNLSSLGETHQLSATVRDQKGATMSSASVAWASSPSSVAAVSPTGLVTAVSVGSASVTATSGSAEGTAAVTVQQAAESIALSHGALVLAGPGDSETLTVLVMDAGGSEIPDPDLAWSSDDEAIATVSSTGFVTAVASGSATITVQATSGSQTLTEALSVTVEDAALVDPSGGVVSLAGDAVSLVLPAGAVGEQVFLTAEPATGLPAEPTPIPGTAFDFGPDGLVFDEPVTLTIGYDPADLPQGVTEGDLGLYELIVGDYVQVDGSTVDVANNAVSGVIDGFSVFAIVRELAVQTASLPDGVENVAYSEVLTATGGNGSYSWALASGSGPLPTGLNLTVNGDITGTPTVPGTSNFAVEVTSGGRTAQRVLSITVHPTLAVTTALLPDGVENVAYSEALTATGGDGSYSWALAIGPLPTGLSLSASSGVISGTPTAAGTWDFVVEVTSGTQTAQGLLSIRVNTTLAVTTMSLPDGAEGAAYSRSLTATGGDGSYSWALAPGSAPLPVGLDLAATGDVTGTPTAAGTSSFTVEVTSGGQTAQLELSITVLPGLAVTTASLEDGVENVAYSEALTATGGDGSYSWTVVAGSLPVGLDPLATNGDITGTPTSAGTSNFTVEVTSGGQMAQQVLSITVLATLEVTTTSLPDGTPGDPYSETLEATGGDGTYTWSVANGSLPTGLSLNTSTGEISGMPTGSGSTFTVEVSSGDGQTDMQQLTIDVTTVLSVFTTSLPNGIVNIAYSRTLTATGGEGGYSWALAGGSGPLPTGLILAASGNITGTPTIAGTWNFTVEVTSGGQAAEQALSIEVVPVLLPSQMCSDFSDEAIASFAEGSLESAVRDALGLGAQDNLTCGLLETMTSLNADGLGITSLVGLQNATGLTNLQLFGNSITNISSLSGLTNLTTLSLRANSVGNIGPLSGLTNLTTLALHENSITDISALGGLTSLAVVGLTGNSALSDIQPLVDNPGLGPGDFVALDETNVTCSAVAELQAKGVTVTSTCAIALSDGVPVTGLAGAQGEETHFVFTVPAGSSLVVMMSGGTGDADLYVREGAPPTTTEYDCRPFTGANQETCQFASPGSGDWYIMVRGWTAYSGVTLTASTSVVLEDGVPVTGLAGGQDEEMHFVFAVPPGASLLVTISGGTGDADLYVREGAPPTTDLWDCRPYIGGNVETCEFLSPASGSWFIMLRGFTSYSGVTLTASTSAPGSPASPFPTPGPLPTSKR